MPADIWDKLSRQRLRENITLLWTLTETPEKPKNNTIPKLAPDARLLSFEREKEIVDNLAFLSAFEHDPLKVMAVCIQEDVNQDYLIIRTASNTGVPQEVQEGFEKIARVLEQAALRVNSKNDDIRTLFRLVTILDQGRILSRLRSKHAKRTQRTVGKPALLPQLNTAVHDKSIKATEPGKTDNINNVRTKTTKLERLSIRLDDTSGTHLESFDAQNVMMDLVQGAYELTETTQLEEALETYQTINPELKKILPEAIGKVGRYYSASRDLIRAARSTKYSIFKAVRIEICQIPRFQQPTTSPQDLPSLVEVLRRISGKKRHVKALRDSVTTYTRKPLSSVEKTFRDSLIAGTRTSRVHAEIQLLSYYELHPELQRPRVISSSKSACYLCNLFIHLHGIFYTPRTHGRIYDKWTLPIIGAGMSAAHRKKLIGVFEQFNKELEKKIRSTISARRTICHHPNESVLPPPGKWSASTLPIDPMSASALGSVVAPHMNQLNHANVSESGICAENSRPAENRSSLKCLESKPFTPPQEAPDIADTTAKITPVGTNLSIQELKSRDGQQASGGSGLSDVGSRTHIMSRYDIGECPTPSDTVSLERMISSEKIAPIDGPEWQKLPDPSRPPIEVNIDNLHLILSLETRSEEKHHDNKQSEPRDVLVRMRMLDRDNGPLEVCSNSVDIQNLTPGEDFVVEQEGRDMLTRLNIRYKHDVVAIKYRFT